MSGFSYSRIRDLEVKVYMGYDNNSGEITIGKESYESSLYPYRPAQREKIKKILMNYKKSEIVEMIMDLIDNSEEG